MPVKIQSHIACIRFLFAANVLVILVDILAKGLGYYETKPAVLYWLEIVLPITAILWHGYLNLGAKNLFLFFALTFLLGLDFEVVGVNYGTAFGSYYSYNMVGPSIFKVPLVIPFFWFVFIYTAYTFTNALYFWNKQNLPNFKNKKIGQLVGAIALDAFLVTAIDLAMEPVMIKLGFWSWSDVGAYYQVPLGNFYGWFLVAFLASSVFRGYNYLQVITLSQDAKINLLPVLGYGFAIFSFLLFYPALGISFFSAWLYFLVFLPLLINVWRAYRYFASANPV